MPRHKLNGELPMADICRAFGADYDVVYKRIQRRWNWKDALTCGSGEKTEDHKLSIRKHGFSWYALARSFNIHPNTLVTRINYGWDIKEALEKPVQVRRDSHDT